MLLSFTESQTLVSLRSFLMNAVSGVPVVQGQANRVASPSAANYMVYWPIRRRRIETNTDTYADAVFGGSISGTVLSITSVAFGSLAVGSTLFGTGVAVGTTVTSLAGGTGGVGAYNVSPLQSASPELIAAGVQNLLQPTELCMQIDVHGPQSADNAQIITTLFRDGYAVDFFQALGVDVTPLYADDPKQVPFINDQRQYENRWVVEAHLQANQSVQVPQQFMSSVVIGLIEVEATFPAT